MFKTLCFFQAGWKHVVRAGRSRFVVFQIAISFLLIVGTISCNNYREADPVISQYAKINDVSRDTIIIMANRESATGAAIMIEGMLSDTAMVKFFSDTLFSQRSGLVLPIHSNQTINIGGLTGDSLFINYHPLKKTPISGNLSVKVTFQ
jgi:hypothetical protein